MIVILEPTNFESSSPSDFWNYQVINDNLAVYFGPNIELTKNENMSRDNAVEIISENVAEKMKKKEEMYSSEMMRYMERTVLLRLIDQYWKEHLLNLDRLRQGIYLRAYGQRDPLNEYKQEAFSLFERMSDTIRAETVKTLSLFELSGVSDGEALNELVLGEDSSSSENMDDTVDKTTKETLKKQKNSKENDIMNGKKNFAGDVFSVSRNAPCPCGSGKRYKDCHGKIE